MGSSILPEHSGLVDVSEGSESSATDLPVPEAQLLVNGLTEAQAWFLGWLRDCTQSLELLDAIECIEVQTQRKNEVGPPPICSMEAILMAGTQDINRETTAVPLTVSDAAGCSIPSVVPVVRGNLFLFPPILVDASTFAGLVKRSFGSKTTPRREAIQLYKITHRELEHRI